MTELILNNINCAKKLYNLGYGLVIKIESTVINKSNKIINLCKISSKFIALNQKFQNITMFFYFY